MTIYMLNLHQKEAKKLAKHSKPGYNCWTVNAAKRLYNTTYFLENTHINKTQLIHEVPVYIVLVFVSS